MVRNQNRGHLVGSYGIWLLLGKRWETIWSSLNYLFYKLNFGHRNQVRCPWLFSIIVPELGWEPASDQHSAHHPACLGGTGDHVQAQASKCSGSRESRVLWAPQQWFQPGSFGLFPQSVLPTYRGPTANIRKDQSSYLRGVLCQMLPSLVLTWRQIILVFQEL